MAKVVFFTLIVWYKAKKRTERKLCIYGYPTVPAKKYRP